MILFQNEKLTVRKLELHDKQSLLRWLTDPSVLQFYEGRDQSFSLEMVEKKFYNRESGVERCLIEYDKKAIGYIQYYKVTDEELDLYGYFDKEQIIYGMDQFIGEVDYWNKGIGTKLVSSMVKYLINEMHATKIVMDPQIQNNRAIACYEKCGFKKIKLLPKNELHEGEFRDCWLIEYAK